MRRVGKLLGLQGLATRTALGGFAVTSVARAALAQQVPTPILQTELRLTPDLDPAVAGMTAQPAQILPTKNAAHRGYFDQPIQAQIHQIWFGGLDRVERSHIEAWRTYAERFGYIYNLWTEQDMDRLKELLPPKNFAHFSDFLEHRNYYAASDIIRPSLLRHIGGIYIDVDFAPPQIDGDMVDFRDIVPMRNLVLMTEVRSRNVGLSSVFVGNYFIMASTHHPLIEHLESSIAMDIDSMQQHGKYHPSYLTGPFFVSRSLAGVFSIFPLVYAVELGMFPHDLWQGLLRERQ